MVDSGGVYYRTIASVKILNGVRNFYALEGIRRGVANTVPQITQK